MNTNLILNISLLLSLSAIQNTSFCMEEYKASQRIIPVMNSDGAIREIDIDDMVPGWFHGSFLHLVVSQGEKGKVAEYIARGADINRRDQYGSTPLIVSALTNQPECARLLLERGADASLFNSWGFRALDMAQVHDAQEIVELLKEYNADKFSNLGWSDDETALRIEVDGSKLNKLPREHKLNFNKIAEEFTADPANSEKQQALRHAAVTYGFIENTPEDREWQRSGLYKQCKWQKFWIPFDMSTFCRLSSQKRRDYLAHMNAYLEDDQNLGNYRKLLSKATELRFERAEQLAIAFDKCMKQFIK